MLCPCGAPLQGPHIILRALWIASQSHGHSMVMIAYTLPTIVSWQLVKLERVLFIQIILLLFLMTSYLFLPQLGTYCLSTDFALIMMFMFALTPIKCRSGIWPLRRSCRRGMPMMGWTSYRFILKELIRHL